MNKKAVTVSFIIFAVLLFAVVVGGLLLGPTKNNQATNQSVNSNANLTPTANLALTPDELAKHNTQSDCWLLIEGKIYDVTGYINKHPGGAGTIIPTCGQEATEAYNTMAGRGRDHSPRADQLLQNYYLGDLTQ